MRLVRAFAWKNAKQAAGIQYYFDQHFITSCTPKSTHPPCRITKCHTSRSKSINTESLAQERHVECSSTFYHQKIMKLFVEQSVRIHWHRTSTFCHILAAYSMVWSWLSTMLIGICYRVVTQLVMIYGMVMVIDNIDWDIMLSCSDTSSDIWHGHGYQQCWLEYHVIV